MITVRRFDAEKGVSVFNFEKTSGKGNILVLTKGVKGWNLEVPATNITTSSSNMTEINELSEALSKVVQVVESDGFNCSGIRSLPGKDQPQISTVGTAVSDKKEKKTKKSKV